MSKEIKKMEIINKLVVTGRCTKTVSNLLRNIFEVDCLEVGCMSKNLLNMIVCLK